MKITGLIIVIVIALLVIYDLIIYVKCGVGSTISHTLLIASKDNPAIPFGFGFICGHWFWENKED